MASGEMKPGGKSGVVISRKTRDGDASGITMYKSPRGESVIVVNKDVYDRARDAAKKKKAG